MRTPPDFLTAAVMPCFSCPVYAESSCGRWCCGYLRCCRLFFNLMRKKTNSPASITPASKHPIPIPATAPEDNEFFDPAATVCAAGTGVVFGVTPVLFEPTIADVADDTLPLLCLQFLFSQP